MKKSLFVLLIPAFLISSLSSVYADDCFDTADGVYTICDDGGFLVFHPGPNFPWPK